MPVAQTNRSISFPGYSFAEAAAVVDTELASVWVVDIAANPSTNTGVITATVATLNASHTIVTSGLLVDAYWAAGRRYGCSAAVAGADVTLTGGAGDSLPTGATAITLCTQKTIDVLPITGDQLKWLAVVYSNASDTGAKGSLDMQDAGGSEKQWDLIHYTLLNGLSNMDDVSGGDTNPVAGDLIVKGYTSHDSTSAGRLYILALIDPTV